MTTIAGPVLQTWLDEHNEELVAFRRHLHSHPEPSGQEHETTSLLMERLDVAGLEPRVLACGTGVICDIGDSEGPMIALRGDIDALEMDDEKDVLYRSQVPGVAHACGHDVHTSVVLGTGLYLSHLAERLPGRVRLIFQPAEERVPGGALEVIADDGLHGVDTILGLHCDPKLDVGKLGFRAGAITSAADMAEITLTGPGGHTARPELTVDLVRLAATIATELPGAVARELGEVGPIKLVFGALQTGEAANVIPTHALLRASVRTPSMAAWHDLPAAFERAVASLIAGTIAEAKTNYIHGVPPAINSAKVTALAQKAVGLELSEGAITRAEHSWGGDDFAWYLRTTPGTFIRLGTHDPSAGDDRRDLHVGHFDVDERAIGVGVRVLTATIERCFKG